MIGDFTAPPLRREERWTGARMQQGRVLVDQDWNLNVDSGARGLQELAADVVGPSGVVAGSTAFKVRLQVKAGSPTDLALAAGRMWVAGLEAFAPAPFSYGTQDRIGPWPLPTGGRLLVYLDACVEHVQGAEAPAEVVDPALAPGDSTTRTRVGYRVRAVATADVDGERVFAAMAAAAVAEKPAPLSIRRRPAAAGAVADPCDLPGRDGGPPDGLLRVEVLDAGPSGRPARMAWSFENGAATATVAAVDTSARQVTLAPSATVAFAPDDLVELSWLARRADRADHGALFRVAKVAPAPTGDVVTLGAAIPAGAARVAGGLVLRRWDGEYAGDRTAEVVATRRGVDVGVRFQAGAGPLAAGDWWAARLRVAAVSPVEERTDAAPDGTQHFLAPLALVDLAAGTVVDLRRSFRPLTEQPVPAGSCTVLARPGDNLQAKIDDPALANGGQLCLAAGYYPLDAPLKITRRNRLVISGTGPGTVLHANNRTPVAMFDTCQDVEVRDLAAEGGGVAAGRAFGALSFVACRAVRVANCDLSCPDAPTSTQSDACCVCVLNSDDGRTPSDQVSIERNRFVVGAFQRGVFVVGVGTATVAGNQLRAASQYFAHGIWVQRVSGSLQVRDNVVDGAANGILVDGVWVPGALLKDGGGEALLARNVLHLVGPATASQVGISLGGFRIVHVLDTVATLTRLGTEPSPPNQAPAIRIGGSLGPLAVVRQTAADGFDFGLLVLGGTSGNNARWLWLVADMVVTGRAGARGVNDGTTSYFTVDRVVQ